MKRILIYLFHDEKGVVDDYIVYKLSQLRSLIETILVVSNSPLSAEARAKLESVADIVHERENVGFDVWGYKEAIEHIGWERLSAYDELTLMNYTFFGPIFPFEETFEKMDRIDCDFWGLTAHKAMTPNPFTGEGRLPMHINSHWISVRKSMIGSADFREYWASMPAIGSYVDSILKHESRFTEHFTQLGYRHAVTFPLEDYPTEYPAFQSIVKMVEDRCPIVKRRLFFHDPLFLEQNAVILRDAMEIIEEKSEYDTGLIWDNILRTAEPRVIHTNLDLFDVVSEVGQPRAEGIASKIAVMAHLYYDDMVEETMRYVDNIPYAADLFVTTNTEEKRANIARQLGERGRSGKIEVRVTEQNRGRDMSSLFITFKDVLLSGKYDYVCRLHSKKSPQNGHNMALLFKQHMFDNLLWTPGYVANIIDMFEREPKLGMVMPPVVQIAYPTLGHAWFSNKEPAKAWAQKIGIDITFDAATPMAPYGTMFWFRPAAIRKIVEYPLKWTDFDPEPNHVDGSLAHVLERLLGYAAMSEGYYLRCVSNRRWASINYTKLEYKLQSLASTLPNGNIFDQLHWIGQAQRLIARLQYCSGKNPWSEGYAWLEESARLHGATNSVQAPIVRGDVPSGDLLQLIDPLDRPTIKQSLSILKDAVARSWRYRSKKLLN